MSWVWDVEMRDDEARLCATRALTIAVREHGAPMSKIQLGFFSFTGDHRSQRHHSYNEWHQLDHMPEQFPLDGIAFRATLGLDARVPGARAVSEPPLDAIHYMTLYLMTEPVERTLAESCSSGAICTRSGGSTNTAGAALGPVSVATRRGRAAGPDLRGGSAVPPNRGVYVEVEEVSDVDGESSAHAAHLGALCALAGWRGVVVRDDQRRVTVSWLDAPPLGGQRAAGRARGAAPRRIDEPHCFAGPFETITPWQWDWFDPCELPARRCRIPSDAAEIAKTGWVCGSSLALASVLFVACGSGSSTGKGAEPASLPSTSPTTVVVEDAKLRAADFPNINEMTRVDDHFVGNVRGHLAQALAVVAFGDGRALSGRHRPPTGAAGGDGEARAGLQPGDERLGSFFSLDCFRVGNAHPEPGRGRRC